MAALLIDRPIAFDIDAEMDSLLNDLSNEDLGGFVNAFESSDDFDTTMLNVYVHVLIFRRTDNIGKLEQAIRRTKEWVEKTPEDHAGRALQLRILVQMLGELTRHKLGSMSPVTAQNNGLVDKTMLHDVDYAIEVSDAALKATPEDHPDRLAILNDLAAWLGMQFLWRAAPSYLTRAVEIAQEALNVTQPDHQYRRTVLTNLGSWRTMLYKRTRSLDDLNYVIQLAREALRLTPEGHSDLATALTNLASRLHIRFEHNGSWADLDEAINLETRASKIIPQDHPERPNILINLAAWLGTRYQRARSAVDLSSAVDLARLALALIHETNATRDIADRNLQVLLSMEMDQLDMDIDYPPLSGVNASGGSTTSAFLEGQDVPSPESSYQVVGQMEGNRTKLDFASAPTVEDIRHVIEHANSGKVGSNFQGTCKVYWNMREFCEQELDPGFDLHSVVTLTGTPTRAETNTCDEFMKRVWGSSVLIDFLVRFLEGSVVVSSPCKLSEDLCITVDKSSAGKKQKNALYTSFSISGSQPNVAQLIQQLSWLTAVFTLPTKNVLTISTANVDVSLSGLIEIRPKTMAPGDLELDAGGLERSPSCWHRLLPGATLAYGFPISKHEEGVGLEIPFDLMVSLADIRTQIDVGGGATLLGGPGIVLYPTKTLKNGVQWHCAGIDDDDYVAGSDKSMAVLEDYDLNDLSGRRTFLGYYSEAEVLLGTMELVNSKANGCSHPGFPLAPPRIEFANEGTISPGISVKGIFTLAFAAKYQLSKTLRVSLEGRGYHDLVDEAQRQPTIIYDGETKSAWLVSELSVVLHLVLSYLSNPHIQDRRQSGCTTVDGKWPLLPYAEPSADGGVEARRVCKHPENCKLALWADGTKTKTFSDMVEDTLRDFRTLRDGVVVQRKASALWPQKCGLRGWEYSDLLMRSSQMLQREVPRDNDHEAPWWDLVNSMDTLVILGSGFGSIIRPKAKTKNPIEPTNIPIGSRLLIASKPCINVLKTSDRDAFIIGSLEWRSVKGRPPSCNMYCDERSCRCIQVLRKENPSVFHSDPTEPPKRKVLQAQAVIFGESEHYHAALKMRWVKQQPRG